MPAGLPYFAWIEASETTFGPEHLRYDESVFSFRLAQEEGDPATLTAVVRRPRNEAGDPIGLLGPGRKIWIWFAFDCGPDLIRFRGRLVGIPTSIFEELVTLEFIARPFDVVAQKEALADTLRVLPFYDEAVIEPSRRDDPEVVLEGYTAIWHYDRETHVITISDEITGEDGLVEFLCANGDVFYDGLGLTLTSGPLSRVDLSAEYTWTQRARGTVDLTDYLRSNWPGPGSGRGYIQLQEGNWPKKGTSLGDGWEVADSSAKNLYDFTPHTETINLRFIVKMNENDISDATITDTRTEPSGTFPRVLIPGAGTWHNEYKTTHDGPPSSISRQFFESASYVALQTIQPTLAAGYTAERQCTEKVSLTLFADVQHILTDPEDGEALRIENIHSINLSEGEALIGDQRRRSYITTERGNRSLEHLIVLARAHLMKRARVVEIAFVPKLSRMPEITLRKSAFLAEPRVGEALGKIIGYSLALDGEDGAIKCQVRIGCAIGHGGTAATTDGEPTYCTIDYAGADYQQFNNRTVVFLIDSSVGYQPPNADPNDDGINFLGGLLTHGDIIEQGLSVIVGPEAGENGEEAEEEQGEDDLEKKITARFNTLATFKLKSMKREFTTEYELQVTDLMIPTGYDLEAV